MAELTTPDIWGGCGGRKEKREEGRKENREEEWKEKREGGRKEFIIFGLNSQ